MRVISSNIVRMYLRALRRLDPDQVFDRAHVGVLVAHHRHVVEAIHVADRLVERLGLGQLLGTAMQQADVRVGAHHDFAVHLQHQAQHAVRGRMLRAEVHRVVADLFPHCFKGLPRVMRAAGIRSPWPARSASSRITRGTPTRGSIDTGS
jgi:hypothetical protein